MRKQNFLLIALVGVLLLLMLSIFISCEQEETYAKATVETSQVTSITEATATLVGIITSDGGSEVTSQGFCWSTSPTPTIENDTTIATTGTLAFTSSIKGLTPGTTYYVRAFAMNKGGVAYGLNMIFITKTFSIATTPISVFLLTATSAIGGGNIISDGDSSCLTVVARGVCWNTFPSPTIENSKTIDGIGGGRFKSKMDSLTAFTTYYVRAYATNGNGTIYGNEVSFTTQNGIVGITTNNASSITISTATCGGSITSDGGATITERGLCWNTSPSPTTANSKTVNLTSADSYSININGLTPDTKYYVRAYAINSIGISYGNEVSFTTQSGVVGMTTTAASAIMAYTASSGGTVSSEGGAAVTARGVCWSTSSAPTINNLKTSNGSGIGTYTSSITGLTPGTTYYVRSYATNSVGTSYGNEVTFTTQSGVVGLATTAASAIMAYTSSSGGTVSSDGGAAVTARGVCWSTSSAPTINNLKTSNGSGIGTYTSSITGLTPGMTYYVRSYATNSVGTSYGNEVTFTTQSGVVGLATTAASAIMAYTSSSGGTVSSDGGAAVTARGVCWSTSSAPTIDNLKTSNGSGIGTYTSRITGLTPGTTYYVRSYATNSVGTSYGNQVSFTSLTYGTLTDIEGNVYTTVTIGTQTWMVENLKTTKYNDGTSISLASDRTAWLNLMTPAYCFYNNDAANITIYGVLYNWYTVYTNKLAPTGWHIPTDDEWTTLTTYLTNNGFGYGGSGSGIAKSMASIYGWMSAQTVGTVGNDLASNNSSGFACLPGGYRNSSGTFGAVGNSGGWWSSSEDSTGVVWCRSVDSGGSNVYRYSGNKQYGFSVRCVRDY